MTLKDWLIRMDNAHLHNSRRVQECIKVSRAERLPHPAYNPDLAPSNFFLFVYIKGKLSDYNCQSLEELLSVITEFLWN
jgi:hypothetical protein